MAIVFAVLIALRFLWIAHAIFIVTFLGALAGLALSPAVDWLERHRVRRGLGAPVAMLLVIGMLIGTFAAIALSVRTQTRDIAQEFPKQGDPRGSPSEFDGGND